MAPDFEKLWAISWKYGPLKSWGGPDKKEEGNEMCNSRVQYFVYF